MMRFASKLYNWVALIIVVGALVGYFFPATGAAMQPVADGFINLIKMLIPPVILCTVVSGIAGAGSIKKAGKGRWQSHCLFRDRQHFRADHRPCDGQFLRSVVVSRRPRQAGIPSWRAPPLPGAAHPPERINLLKMIPKTFFSAFTEGEILQVLVVSVLLGFALARLTDTYKVPLLAFLENVTKLLFGVMRLILYTAPLGAGAAIAFTIGKSRPAHAAAAGCADPALLRHLRGVRPGGAGHPSPASPGSISCACSATSGANCCWCWPPVPRNRPSFR